MDELLDVFLKEELRIVNRHLPRERVSLCRLLEMEIPYIITSDGGIHVFDYKELELLAKISNKNCSLKLPIILEYVPEGEGIYVVKGSLEAEVVSKVLKLHTTTPLILHRTSVLELRRALRTTTTILLNPGALSRE